MVRWKRSTLPVVVGEYGAVSRWRMPLLAQIRSKSTGPGPWPNRAVKTLPLSVNIWSGTVGAQCPLQCFAHRPGRRPGHDAGADAVTAVVVDAGDRP